MKRIQTRLFRIDGVWQLGFEGLNRDDRAVLAPLRGFRYNAEVRMWHITFHASTVKFLNDEYQGRYSFTEDRTPRDQVPDVKADRAAVSVQIRLRRDSDLLVVTHRYDRKLFEMLGQVPGGKYDRAARCWVFSIKQHYDAIQEIVTHHETKIFEESSGRPSKDKISSASGGDLDDKLVDRFRRELVIRNQSKRTIETYLGALVQFQQEFHGRNMQEIQHEEIRNYLHRLATVSEFSYSTLNVHISAIKAFYKMVFQALLDPIAIPRPKGSKQLPKVVSEEEIRRMVESSPNLKHRTIITTLYATGIRRDELLGITLQALDLREKQILIHGKGDKERVVYIPVTLETQLIGYLKAYRPQVYLFEGRPGGRYSSSSVARIVSRAGRKAGVAFPVTPHMLRHSYATHLLSKGVSILHIQKLLGHSSIKTTMIYTHVTNNDLRDLPNPLDALGL